LFVYFSHEVYSFVSSCVCGDFVPHLCVGFLYYLLQYWLSGDELLSFVLILKDLHLSFDFYSIPCWL
jgi:hypothetical protein